jgi:ribosomal protein S18 acetylase RimI-like enzyme
MIRAWQRDDVDAMQRAANGMSLATLSARFFTGTSQLPPSYIGHVLTAGPRRWDAVVAVEADEIIGWAEYGRDHAWSQTADLGVLVTDRWQRRGLGMGLIRAAMRRGERAGVTAWRAEVQSTNVAAQRLVRSLFGEHATVTIDLGLLTFESARAEAVRRRPTRVPAA